MKVRSLVLWLVLLLVLVFINLLIVRRENQLASGQVVFLELAPVDPRSLLQGDYMILRYAVSQQVDEDQVDRDGFLVMALDERSIARFVRIHDPDTPLAENEILLRYRRRAFDVRIGPESFFFQEGDADFYSEAEYAEMHVSPEGDVLISGLRGENLEVLGPPE